MKFRAMSLFKNWANEESALFSVYRDKGKYLFHAWKGFEELESELESKRTNKFQDKFEKPLISL